LEIESGNTDDYIDLQMLGSHLPYTKFQMRVSYLLFRMLMPLIRWDFNAISTGFWLLFCAFYLGTFSQGRSQSRVHEVNQNEIPVGTKIIGITGTTIFDGTGRVPVPNGCVVVVDGKITEVGPCENVNIPHKAQIVDGKGLSLLPGLIDSHFHLDGVKDLPALFLEHGVTSVRDPGAWIEAYDGERNSGKSIPRLFLSGPHLDMFPPAYPKDAYVVRDQVEAVNQVNRAGDQGASSVKIYFRLPVGIITEVCKAAHSRGLPVTAHLEITEAKEAIEAGLDGVEHITSFGLSLLPRPESEKYRQMILADNNARKQGRYDVWGKLDVNGTDADNLAKFVARKGTFVSPTLGAFEYQTPRQESGVAAGQNQLVPDRVKLSAFNNMKVLTAKFKKSGVRIVVGSHSIIPYAELGWAYQREMELLVESGLSPMEVIVAATLENARYFRIEDRLGSIEKGKVADLILVKGNPGENISDLRRIEKVMLNGKWIR
jgi:imidazolonepropionase-like amidohydrolase